MEYFPLGNISSNLLEFRNLKKCNAEIKRLETEMKKLDNQEDFGKYKTRWQEAHKLRDKILDCSDRLVKGVYDSLHQFHTVHDLVHLDVKGTQC